MKHLVVLILLGTLAGVASAALGENINLDFGSTKVAASAYPAAGTAGVWNAIDSLDTSGVSGLVDASGGPTSLSVSSSAKMFDVTPGAQPFSGDDAALLGDYIVTVTNNVTLTFTGLPSGVYRIVTYTIGRQDFPFPSTVTPFGNASLAKTNTGVWAGSFEEGVTHSVHVIDVPAGGFTLDVASQGDAFLTGMQIEPVLEPATNVRCRTPRCAPRFGCSQMRRCRRVPRRCCAVGR